MLYRAFELLVNIFSKHFLDKLKSITESFSVDTANMVEGSDHITPLLRDLHWLPVASRIQFKILLLTFKALNGLAPPYLAGLLHNYSPVRSLRSAEQGPLSVPRYRLSTAGGQSFSIAAPKLWNSLPLTLCKQSSLSSFKPTFRTNSVIL